MTAPTLLFGAHDRHNFGDLLFAHVAASYLPGRTVIPAGLIERDLSPYGGLRVEAVGELSRRLAGAPVELIHIGGEILTTTAEQAVVMLATPEAVADLIARFDADPLGTRAYAAQCFGFTAVAPYVAGRALFPQARRIIFNAVGGADLDCADPKLHEEVVAKLAAADRINVRDRATHATLSAAGIVADLAPDPVAVIRERFAARIAREMAVGEVAQSRRRFPAGFVAVQFAAECGDDATLGRLAAQLDAIAAETGWGIVFFRAGSAPWHDDLDVYRRCAARLTKAAWQVFESLDIWQIVALIASSQGFIGTSLHGHIVASAHALPRVNFLPPSLTDRPNKITAYLAAWEMPTMPGVVAPDVLAEGFLAACAGALDARQQHARGLAARYHRTAQEIFAS